MIPESIRLVMKSWLENQAQLTLVGQLQSLAVALRCRVGYISNEIVGLVTEDGGKLAIDVSEPEVEFRYSEPREFPAIAEKLGLSIEQQFASGLTIYFPRSFFVEGEETEDLEMLHLSELIKP